MMKKAIILILPVMLLACVPMKKYKELQAKYETCQEEVDEYKSKSIDFENKLKELETQMEVMNKDMKKLVADTTKMGNDYRRALAELDKAKKTNASLEKKYEELVKNGGAENAQLINDLERSRIELQQKEDRLNKLEKDLGARERALQEKEQKIQELQEKLDLLNYSITQLKDKISDALRGFADKGITVEERDYRIYVSMEANLLFASGKTNVSEEGKVALIDLAKVLETQEDIDILVEGHTDSDPMRSSSHPRDNWELSVLRATSVTKIMLENSNMNPANITAAGRSEYHPVDPENKAKNRRIEIIIMPDLSALFEFISS